VSQKGEKERSAKRQTNKNLEKEKKKQGLARDRKGKKAHWECGGRDASSRVREKKKSEGVGMMRADRVGSRKKGEDRAGKSRTNGGQCSPKKKPGGRGRKENASFRKRDSSSDQGNFARKSYQECIKRQGGKESPRGSLSGRRKKARGVIAARNHSPGGEPRSQSGKRGGTKMHDDRHSKCTSEKTYRTRRKGSGSSPPTTIRRAGR